MGNKLSWNDLFLKGSVVDLAASRWAARTKIAPRDLGIEPTAEVEAALALGSHRLIPRDKFGEINAAHGRAVRLVHQYSLPFLFVSGARYVPEANLAELSRLLRECQRDFDAAVREFVEEYEAAKAEQLPIIRRALLEAARAPDGAADPEAAEAEVAAAAYARVVAEYPSQEEVAARFALTWNVYAIQGPRAAGAAAAVQDETTVVRSAVKDMMVALRQEMGEKVASVLKLIADGGKLQNRSIESARAVLDHVERVNILGDEVLTVQVARLRGELQRLEDGGEADVPSLQQIETALSASIEEQVRAAEDRLTAVGRRQIDIDEAA